MFLQSLTHSLWQTCRISLLLHHIGTQTRSFHNFANLLPLLHLQPMSGYAQKPWTVPFGFQVQKAGGETWMQIGSCWYIICVCIYIYIHVHLFIYNINMQVQQKYVYKHIDIRMFEKWNWLRHSNATSWVWELNGLWRYRQRRCSPKTDVFLSCWWCDRSTPEENMTFLKWYEHE